ncbi:MAG: hypothetical protein ACOCW9_08800 [Thermodesulfobacteriota bacterium]
MRSLLLLSAVVVISSLSPPVQGAEKEIRHRFSTTGNRYVFTGSFPVNADRKCLMDMLYEPDQLRRYARHADAVELVGKGDRWQTITYDYRKMFYHAKSTFKRELNREKNRIDYRLTSIDQGGLVSPDIQSISGYYGVSAENGGHRVTFHQEGVIGSGMLSGFYFYKAEKEAVGFVENMRDYALKHCK